MSHALYKLVKSLTTNEKAHFKRNASIHASRDSKNYLKIYEVIVKMKTYDKNALAAHFKGTSIQKYLSSEVNYLKEKLLISLFNFNMNKSKRNHIQKGILMVEILAGKGLQKEALRKLKTLKKSAAKQEEFTWILRLIELEEMLIFKEGTMGYKAELEELHQQRSKIISAIQNLNNYHILRQEIRELQFSKKLLNNDIVGLKEIYNNPLISSDQNCMSLKAKEHWFYINVLMSYLKREFSNGLIISFQFVNFMNKNIHLFDSSKILPVISNYIFHAALESDKSHFLKGEKLLLELANRKDIPKSYMKYILYSRNLEFAYYAKDRLLTKEYLSLCINLIEDYSTEFEKAQVEYLLMVVVRASIILKDYNQAIHYCNLWYQIGVLPYRKVQARLFSLIVHFELNYLELISSEIILLKKLDKIHVRERGLIRCFYKFLNSILKHPEKRKQSIITFQGELKSISEKNKGYFTFISFDFHQWSLNLKQA